MSNRGKSRHVWRAGASTNRTVPSPASESRSCGRFRAGQELAEQAPVSDPEGPGAKTLPDRAQAVTSRNSLIADHRRDAVSAQSRLHHGEPAQVREVNPFAQTAG